MQVIWHSCEIDTKSLANSENEVKLVGDKSLSKRDFWRVREPLERFGAKLSLKK